MLPLGQPWRQYGRCWATIGIMAACLYVFLWELCLPGELAAAFVRNWGLIPLRFVDSDFTAAIGLQWPAVLTPLTYQLLHGGWVHLIGNMWMLWVFGREIETQWGAKKMLGLFVASGVSAGLLHSLVHYESAAPVVGASGAVAGIMGAFLVLKPFARIRSFVPVFFLPVLVDVPAVIFIGMWCMTQVFNGTLAVMVGSGAEPVAWWAHIGGFLAGMCLARMSQDRRPVSRESYYRQSFAHYY